MAFANINYTYENAKEFYKILQGNIYLSNLNFHTNNFNQQTGLLKINNYLINSINVNF